jgi:DeoR family transcriptional regulator of aga operon
MASIRDKGPVSLRAAVRHEEIRSALASAGSVSTPELADRLGVTQVTVREDLKHLEEQGLLTRTRGGALAPAGAEAESALELTSMTNRAEKEAIGAHGASLIRSGHTVILDVGSTTTALAKALSPDLRDVVVITNGLNIAMGLESAPGISVIVTGGTLRPLQHSLVSPMGRILLDQLKADIAFIGCNGVDVKRGITNANIDEAEIKQAMMSSADHVVILADHEKIGHVSSAFVAEVPSADLLITDTGADKAVLKALGECGIETRAIAPAV